MKKLFISLSLVTILGTSYAQKAPEKPAKPFTLTLDEVEANRLYIILNQVKNIIPKSKTPMEDGISILNNTDTAINVINKQYSAWIASNKKDSTSGKK